MEEKKEYTFLYNGHVWFLKIDSLETLNDYLKTVWHIRLDDMIYDIRRIKEKLHLTSDIAVLCETLATAKGTDVISEFMQIQKQQHINMSHAIIEGNTLYVNPAGGYCTSINVINRLQKENIHWPIFSEKDIRIKQWPHGEHYYAYIGPVQVKLDDKYKWDSESDARMAAMTYVNRKKWKWEITEDSQ